MGPTHLERAGQIGRKKEGKVENVFQELKTRVGNKYMNSNRDMMCIYCVLKIGTRLNKKANKIMIKNTPFSTLNFRPSKEEKK